MAKKYFALGPRRFVIKSFRRPFMASSRTITSEKNSHGHVRLLCMCTATYLAEWLQRPKGSRGNRLTEPVLLPDSAHLASMREWPNGLALASFNHSVGLIWVWALHQK